MKSGRVSFRRLVIFLVPFVVPFAFLDREIPFQWIEYSPRVNGSFGEWSTLTAQVNFRLAHNRFSLTLTQAKYRYKTYSSEVHLDYILNAKFVRGRLRHNVKNTAR